VVETLPVGSEFLDAFERFWLFVEARIDLTRSKRLFNDAVGDAPLEKTAATLLNKWFNFE
jgi:hypothetical protein